MNTTGLYLILRCWNIPELSTKLTVEIGSLSIPTYFEIIYMSWLLLSQQVFFKNLTSKLNSKKGLRFVL